MTRDPAPPAADYPPTARTTPTRLRERAAYDRALVHGILDAGYLCHLGFVRDGAPVVLPTLYARHGERLYVHGSTGARPLRAAAVEAGLAVCLTVTHVDGLVLARSAFHHSMNYRSVVVHGTAHQVTDPGERSLALDAIVDQAVPGRSADSRRANAKELASTAVLRLDLGEVSAKVRTGGPSDEPEDAGLPYWTGVVPVRPSYGTPVPADDLDPSIGLPGYLAPGGPRGTARTEEAPC
ncbi:pyridoxamine 5'-phosphate oxidase family protein [Actinacidiphila rubida]|uniref:Nitroimidazol reductase NimA, pyridoxamine 5'-phosphate oxidase superfamily n=1 Tax=Actinacidiphila rubida TaxID=310780 RepID=A0A1H8IZ12_9ACTN|nr:pyridoxamine 5'-phosphate oxidase family protein [Actinacidiphila rubida]SEN73167.1 Nitroimidazol reductase NimA, pyridoxamine 5'-phosphate oxidase superfamily [Actinacidiphila rubida]